MNQYTDNLSINHVAREWTQRLSEDVVASHGMHVGEYVYWHGLTFRRHVMRRDSSGAQQLEQQASGQSSSTIRKALRYKHAHDAS